ncbi:30S ribosomal protein S1 [Thermodesulfomicrobium sp. WS]|uniref:S1 RNA-binding domain-containing protein n=1 Tax=Thermodesulfomicrobium sp. WS TaxID=3004129 RepID=UPI002492ED23|nr:S1 RNA-binding domain-containing protein [Thermodesulfomicrobium sp. WS]BDV01503.1 30S ribosomal protein S1 [Thermodesulfomicrobium sp. WS]
MSEDFASLLAQYEERGAGARPKVGDRVQATVVAIGEHAVFVDVGAGVDGVVLREDLLDAQGELAVAEGDVLDLYVVAAGESELRLARSVSGVAGLGLLEEAFAAGLPVEGRVSAVVKGGVEVQVAGRRAFCPASQIGDRSVEDLSTLVGQTFRFVITTLGERGRNIVLSRRKLLEEERRQSQETFFARVREGDVLEGTVTRLASFGAFVEVAPGLEGLVHVSELSWSRGVQPEDILAVGERVRVKFLGRSPDAKSGGERISLSLKQAGEDPWQRVAQEAREGEISAGTVTRLADFGAFVELWPGVEGLIHVSEMGRRVRRPDEVVRPGDAVRVRILAVDLEARRLSLALAESPAGARETEDRADDWRRYASASQGLGSLGQALAKAMHQKKRKE